MTTSQIPLVHVLVALLSGLSCLAQNVNNTTDLDKCPRTIGSLDSTATVNSTGKVALRFDAAPNEDWFFSVTLNDTRSSVLVSMLHDLQGYISFPQSTTTGRGCFYQFNGVNASVSGTGTNTCEGVLSAECVDLLREISFPTPAIGGSGDDLECQRIPNSELLNEVCPDGMLTPGVAFSSKPVDFTNKTCTVPAPPGVAVPEQYDTTAVMGTGSGPTHSDGNASSFAWYDLFVQQPVPWVIAASFGDGRRETQVACVAPDNVVDGSRVPENAPWKSAGVGAGWQGTGRLATVLALAVTAMQTLC